MNVENGLVVLIAILGTAAVGSFVLGVRAVAPFRHGVPVPTGDVSELRSITRSLTTRVFIGLAVFVVSFVILIVVAYAFPELFALPGLMAPGVAVSLGLLTLCTLPASRRAPEGVVSATLERRGPWTFAPPLSLCAVALGGASTVALSIGLGVAATENRWGFAGLSTPPILVAGSVVVAMVMVMCLSAVALQQLAATRAGAVSDLTSADFALRTLVSRLIVGVAASNFAFYMAVVAGQTGGSLAGWARVSVLDGRPDALAATLGAILEPLGLLSAAASIAFAITSIMLIVSLTRSRSVGVSAGTVRA